MKRPPLTQARVCALRARIMRAPICLDTIETSGTNKKPEKRAGFPARARGMKP
jgi:hypothetical protein